MIFVVNYASDRFHESQRIQNKCWRALHGDRVTICSFSRRHVLPILQQCRLANEGDIREVLRQPRGDGLWAWKAILTYHVYENLAEDGDIVFYMDSGACPILPFDAIWRHTRAHNYFFAKVSAFESVVDVRNWLLSLPSMAVKGSLLDAFDFSSRWWTKPLQGTTHNRYGLPECVLRRLAWADDSLPEVCERVLDMEQVCGGFQGYLKADGNDHILRCLLQSTTSEFFDDVVRTDARRAYIDHRHDQSMLSLIVNAECLRTPAFAQSIVDAVVEVRLHRGYGLEPSSRCEGASGRDWETEMEMDRD